MKDNTSVKTVELDSLDDLFLPEDLSTIEDEPKKTNVFSPGTDEMEELDPKNLSSKQTASSASTKQEDSDASQENDQEGDEDSQDSLSFEELVNQNSEENKANGRPKTDKSGLVELFKKKIEAGKMVPFDDYEDGDDLSEYLSKLSMKDLEELWDANEQRRVQELEETIPQQFYESLPEELQFAAEYVAKGGTDLKGLFRALAQVEEVRELDPKKDPRAVAYQYLKATNFGNEAEIQEQLDEWEDLNTLTKKAEIFKPKLDKMNQQIVEQKIAEQEAIAQARQRAAEEYVHNVQEALKTPELAGVKIDRKTQEFLINGLLQPVYPSLSGKNTNLLVHLLEKYQTTEPNYQLVAEALWLLSNPDEYRAQIKRLGSNEKTEQHVKLLKTEQSSRKTSTSYPEQQGSASRGRSANRVARPGNVLKR